VGALLVATAIVGKAERPAVAASCGPYRWGVQTLSDPDRRAVDLTPARIGVAALRDLTPPGSLDASTPRLHGSERRVFRVNARIVRATVQPNGDVRAIVAPRDDVNRTMAVEFHRRSCIRYVYERDPQAHARRDLLDSCGAIAAGSFTELKGLVTIEGVGFWNGDPTAADAAPNGIELNPVIGFSGRCWPSDGSFFVMTSGDSVPKQLETPLAAATGWVTADGAVGGCPATGEEPVDASNAGWTTGGDCRKVVLPKQHEAMATHPDMVLWWDRPSISHFRDFGGEFVRSGTRRFWYLRRVAIDRTVHRLTAGGAMVVFVASEPVSPGLDPTRPWYAFLINHYFDTTTRWNATMHHYAERHPHIAAFISITNTVCHAPLTSPCDDSINTVDGTVSARPFGMHYEGPGVDVAVNALLAALNPIVSRLGA
jgi:hypothetical protein